MDKTLTIINLTTWTPRYDILICDAMQSQNSVAAPGVFIARSNHAWKTNSLALKSRSATTPKPWPSWRRSSWRSGLEPWKINCRKGKDDIPYIKWKIKAMFETTKSPSSGSFSWIFDGNLGKVEILNQRSKDMIEKWLTGYFGVKYYLAY